MRLGQRGFGHGPAIAGEKIPLDLGILWLTSRVVDEGIAWSNGLLPCTAVNQEAIGVDGRAECGQNWWWDLWTASI